jgi:hypothetical protein
LDVLLNIDAGGKLTTQLYDKQDYFNFAIVNFPYISSNIPLSSAYGVYISQLIRYARACSTYNHFFKPGYTTERQADNTGVSEVSIDVGVLQVLWPLQ